MVIALLDVLSEATQEVHGHAVRTPGGGFDRQVCCAPLAGLEFLRGAAMDCVPVHALELAAAPLLTWVWD